MTRPGDGETSSGMDEQELQQAEGPSITTEYMTANKEPIMLKGKLRHGKISYEEGDIKIHHSGFEVPDYITQSLLEDYGDISEAEVKIVSDSTKEGVLRWSVDPKWRKLPGDDGKQRAANETMMLKTRVRQGQISFSKVDLKVKHPGWEVPSYITESLKRETSNGELSVISDEKGNLRYTVVGNAANALANYRRAMRKFKV